MGNESKNAAVDFLEYRLKNLGGKTEIKVLCGNWIYPSRDSTTRTRYPISFPLVLNLFMQENELRKEISSRPSINFHLTGPRAVIVEFDLDGKTIRIKRLVNEQEEAFSQDVDFNLGYDVEKITRWDEIRYERGNDYWPSIWLTSALLNAHTAKAPLPEGVTFRKAKIPEIESLGRW